MLPDRPAYKGGMGIDGPGAVSPVAMSNRTIARTQSTVEWGAAVLAVSAFLIVVWLAGAAAAAPAPEKAQSTEHRVIVKTVGESENEGPYLGVTMQELDDHLRKGLDVKVKTGVLVSQVLEGSPAEAGGIEDGDIIVEFDGKRVDSPAGLKSLVGDTKSGEAVKVKVIRDGDSKTLTVTIGEWPEEESFSFGGPEDFIWLEKGKNAFMGAFGQGRLGVQATDLNGDLAPYFGVKEGEGALVLDVIEGSAADEMGIKSGDVITKVKDKGVGSAKDLVGAVGDLEGGEKFDVTLVRSNKTVTLEGEVGEGLAKTYCKVMREGPEKHAAKMRIEKLPGLSDAEVDKLKAEMKELKEELKNLKRELEKVKEST